MTASPEQTKAKEKKWRKVQEMWAKEMPLAKIAERMGWSTGHVKVEMSRMRQAGWHLPKRTKAKSALATQCVICDGPVEAGRTTCGPKCLSELGRQNAQKRHGRPRGR